MLQLLHAIAGTKCATLPKAGWIFVQQFQTHDRKSKSRAKKKNSETFKSSVCVCVCVCMYRGGGHMANVEMSAPDILMPAIPGKHETTFL